VRAFLDFLIAMPAPVAGSLPLRTPQAQTENVWPAAPGAVLCSRPSSPAPSVILHHAACDGWQVWGVGEIFRYAGECKETAGCLAAFAADLAKAQAKPVRLNGHFLVFAWHEAKRQWHAWTDRMGTLHAYHGSDGQRSALGTFFPAVAAAASRRRLDWTALTSFFGFGIFPLDRTFYDDVRILQPASHYVFDERGVLVNHDRYWQWHHEPDPTRSYDQTVDQFAEHFGEVMSDHLREGRIGVPISGGLDSRTAVSAINGNGHSTKSNNRIWAYSYGYGDDSVETRISREVAQARDLPFTSFAIKSYLLDRLGMVMGAVEGFLDVTQCRQAFVATELGRHADWVIAAHWGDVCLGDMGLASCTDLSESAFLNHAQSKMERRGAAWLLEHLCPASRTGEKSDVILSQLVRNGLAPYQHIADLDYRLKAYKADGWVFRWTNAGLRMYQAAAFPRLPFYDSRLTDFFCTVPTRFVEGRRMQIDYLKRHASDLARVTWQAYDTNLFHYHHFNTWLVPKRACKKAWRLLTGKKTLERNWEVQFFSDSGQAGLKHWLLRPGLRLHEFVDPVKVQELVDAFYADPLRDGRGYTICMLFTFSAWLELFG
jgi:asparagine synthase (glutamine-hydrolysing)